MEGANFTSSELERGTESMKLVKDGRLRERIRVHHTLSRIHGEQAHKRGKHI